MEDTAIKTENKIIVAGIGPGNPDYMVPMAYQAIRKAAALVGGRRALAQFAAPAGSGQHTMAVTRDIDGVLAFIREELGLHDVVVMVSGDPGYYSLLDALRRAFPADRITVIPGISSLQLAFARLALPWHDARLASFHGRQPQSGEIRYQQGAVLGMLTDARFTSRTIPPLLMKAGWPADARLHICTRLSYADERIVTITLEQAAEYPETASCILIVSDN